MVLTHWTAIRSPRIDVEAIRQLSDTIKHARTVVKVVQNKTSLPGPLRPFSHRFAGCLGAVLDRMRA